MASIKLDFDKLLGYVTPADGSEDGAQRTAKVGEKNPPSQRTGKVGAKDAPARRAAKIGDKTAPRLRTAKVGQKN